MGKLGGVSHLDRIISQSVDREPILDLLNDIGAEYKNFTDGPGQNYLKFVELKSKHKDLLDKLADTSNETDDTSKADLVLAYEDDLTKYMNDLEIMAKKADLVLKDENWPDLSSVSKKLDKLQEINKEQHVQSVAMDRRTEELIGIYNEILTSFKSNMVLWNQKIEAYENEDKRLDDE